MSCLAVALGSRDEELGRDQVAMLVAHAQEQLVVGAFIGAV
jgi:hypothetical protein